MSRPLASTVPLAAVDGGEAGVLDRLVEAVYPEVKRLAHFQLARERPCPADRRQGGRLSVSHDSENPVELEIRCRSDDSDLHLIVDGQVQELGPDRARNVYRKRLQKNSETGR